MEKEGDTCLPTLTDELTLVYQSLIRRQAFSETPMTEENRVFDGIYQRQKQDCKNMNKLSPRHEKTLRWSLGRKKWCRHKKHCTVMQFDSNGMQLDSNFHCNKYRAVRRVLNVLNACPQTTMLTCVLVVP